MSPIVLGELQSGFRRGRHQARNEKELEEFLDAPRVELIPILDSTAVRYAEILSYLRRAGTPLPTNEVWIAASAMEYGLASCHNRQALPRGSADPGRLLGTAAVTSWSVLFSDPAGKGERTRDGGTSVPLRASLKYRSLHPNFPV